VAPADWHHGLGGPRWANVPPARRPGSLRRARRLSHRPPGLRPPSHGATWRSAHRARGGGPPVDHESAVPSTRVSAVMDPFRTPKWISGTAPPKPRSGTYLRWSRRAAVEPRRVKPRSANTFPKSALTLLASCLEGRQPHSRAPTGSRVGFGAPVPTCTSQPDGAGTLIRRLDGRRFCCNVLAWPLQTGRTSFQVLFGSL
jgi:hypothetical protein